jgi:hypothetical protein
VVRVTTERRNNGASARDAIFITAKKVKKVRIDYYNTMSTAKNTDCTFRLLWVLTIVPIILNLRRQRSVIVCGAVANALPGIHSQFVTRDLLVATVGVGSRHCGTPFCSSVSRYR